MNRELKAIQVMEAAIDLSAESQQQFVQRACNGDSALLRKVRALLAAADDETGFLATRSDFDASPPPTRERIGDYRIIREIGRGGMGIVYEAEHDAMRRRVALKVLSAGWSPSQNQLARFYREARSAGQLHHTNIVPVFEVGSADGLHYYTMQFIEGVTLDHVIDEVRELRKRGDGYSTDSPGRAVARRLLTIGSSAREASESRDSNDADNSLGQNAAEHDFTVRNFSETNSPTRGRRSESTDSIFSHEWSTVRNGRNAYFGRVAAVGLQAAEALEYAHQNGILHRDIKPANLILDTRGIVWVLDFGLAKSGDDNLTMSGDVVGTIRYMAPERFDGTADVRSDIYSLGLRLYELATLQYAFDATEQSSLVKQVTTQSPPSPRKVERRVPRDLETIILKSLNRNPNHRYQSAAEMAEDLRLFVMDHPIHARRISPLERVWRVCRRNPVVSSLAASLFALLIVLAVGSARFAIVTNQEKTERSQQNNPPENVGTN
ncbi:MAG: serine/threonine-protein kinase [Pirellulaceae bacterium]